MSDIIQLLPDSVANQIAAGEVIQRPASVIKELVENAVDAGAESIDVLVVDAGKTKIQVIDDGKGMSDTDARLAFERHATSKIRQADDLFALQTMGFRGEALASIAAVAQVELRTKLEHEEIGTHLSIAGGQVIGQEPCSGTRGSNFSVENLFYNVPARRKFLKSNTTELNNIITAFERIALVYPDINFTLRNGTTLLFDLRAGMPRQRIIDIFGKRLNQDLLPLNIDTVMCKVSGFVGKPQAARKKGAHQYFFVNGRYMKHPYFNKAVMEAYQRLIPVGEQVPYFLYFDVNPGDIDVNIHPTKTEIKFENEQAIWQILSAAVKDALSMFNDVPAIDFDTNGRPDIPVFDSDLHIAAPTLQYNSNYNPFRSTSANYQPKKPVEKWDELYTKVGHIDEQNATLFPANTTELPSKSNAFEDETTTAHGPNHYQYKGKYIVTAVKSGLMLIDQHRAHVRILHDEYLAKLDQREGLAQKMLFPENVQLTANEALTLTKIMPEMQKLGFEITPMGGTTYAIQAVPTHLEGAKADELLHDMLASAQEKTTQMGSEINSALALVMAHKAAIPTGQTLRNEEMDNLFNQLFASTNPNYTPDGKNILAILQQEDIEKLFN